MNTTALPAEIIGLRDRGRIAPGFAADLVVFDPSEVRALATYVDPLELAEGFEMVLVNGEVVRERGALTDGRPGRVLRPDIAIGE